MRNSCCIHYFLIQGISARQISAVNIGLLAIRKIMPLHLYGELAGYWVEQGEAELTQINDLFFYSGSMDRLAVWNADIIYQTIEIGGCVKYEAGNLLSNALLTSSGREYNGTSIVLSNKLVVK